ncbi:hypothetical protein Nepgr_026278 [Nepenthes gracilis]|uniref:Uncharacterized protein n=1 Tax=Nepenthes gracilis TaxID=150966 RepID=A0AAD3Y1W1_NEPGR|nr:hypothetical protein Nepgr_026278 [Nepenthes gracilis]
MKTTKAPGWLKRIAAALSSKTNELRTRIMIFLLLRNTSTLMDTLSRKLHALAGGGLRSCRRKHLHDDDDEGEESEDLVTTQKAAIALNATASTDYHGTTKIRVFLTETNLWDRGGDVNEGEKYLDLMHKLFKESEEEMELTEEGEDDGACCNSRTKMATISGEGSGSGGGRRGDEFLSDEDIDRAADFFIKRFRQQMFLQKRQRSAYRCCGA